MNAYETLLTTNGRIPRSAFWIFQMFALSLLIFLQVLVARKLLPQLAAGIIMCPVVCVGIIIQIKRWHDRNKSGWWVLTPFIWMAIWLLGVYLLGLLFNSNISSTRSIAGNPLIAMLSMLGVLWVAIECGFMKGTEGSNRFGPSPTHPSGSDMTQQALPNCSSRPNYFSIASLICGLIGVYITGSSATLQQMNVNSLRGGLIGILAITLGIVGIKLSQSLREGRGLAIAGLVLGCLAGTFIIRPFLQSLM